MRILLEEKTATTAPRRRLSPTARRGLIDEAATRVFAERGYEAATMQDIARAAGVVASVLYDHYPSKKELYVELLERHGQLLIEQTIRASSGVDRQADLRGQIVDFFSTIEEDPFVWRMLMRDPPGDPEVATVHGQVHARASMAIGAVLTDTADPGGKANPAAEMVAEMVRSSLKGLASWWWEHREVGKEEVIDAATTVIWSGLAGIALRSSGSNYETT